MLRLDELIHTAVMTDKMDIARQQERVNFSNLLETEPFKVANEPESISWDPTALLSAISV